ncbi:MAG TPA: sulfotransferase [Rhizomicrobium sp.]
MDFEDKTFVLGVGAQKAGTSWLRSYFFSRDDIYLSRTEMHFFDAKHGLDSPRRTERLLEKASRRKKAIGQNLNLKLEHLKLGSDCTSYKDFFRRQVPEHVNFFGEITPSYSLIGEAGYREVREIFRNVRIIFIMRDPVERFYSHVRMNRSRRISAQSPQDDVLRRLECDSYVDRSRYQVTISNLENVFSRNELLYLFYETLFTPQTIHNLCAFAGMEVVDAKFDEVVNSGGPRDRMPEEVDRQVRAAFDETYKFCAHRFGDSLPRQWRLSG